MKLLIVTVLLIGLFSKTHASNKTVKYQITNFGWSDCADPKTSGVKITRVEVGPDPLILPGELFIGFDGEATKSLVRGSPFHVRMQKKGPFGIWIKVPCLDSGNGNKIGTCDYDDFCDHWPLPGPECSQSYKDNKIPCECPFNPGHYSMPLLPVGKIKEFKAPGWLEKGDFKLQAWVNPKGSDDKLICISLDLRLDHP